MALYKVTKRIVEISEHSYDVEGKSEDDALRNFTEPSWDKVEPQLIKNTKHTEINIENIL